MTHILHITCDFPDDIDNRKTAAISNLIKNTDHLDHTVFSLNRRIMVSGNVIHDEQRQVFSMKYLGLPFGIGLQFFLKRTAKEVLQIIRSESIAPDIIHCHKLTFEGLIGYYLSQDLGIPMVCSVRGDTDFKLIRFKPGYAGLYRKILRHSVGALFIAPWSKTKLEAMWPSDMPALSLVLPNIVDVPLDSDAETSTNSRQLVTVFHLKDYRRKNIFHLIDAVDACISGGADVSLDIIGGGPDDVHSRLRRHIEKSRHPQNFKMLGHQSSEQIAARLSRYAALLLPSYPETFGMVYLEALRAGIPFLHSLNAGVDGYFSGKNVSVAVDHDSISSITNGIMMLLEQQSSFKKNIRTLAASGYLDQFRTDNICSAYTDFLDQALQSV